MQIGLQEAANGSTSTSQEAIRKSPGRECRKFLSFLVQIPDACIHINFPGVFGPILKSQFDLKSFAYPSQRFRLLI